MDKNRARNVADLREGVQMNITIDARWIFKEISGVGIYTRELIRHLAALDKVNRYTLLFSDASILKNTISETNIISSPNFSAHLLPYGVFSPSNQLLMPGLLKRQGTHIYHSTNYMIPFLAFPRRRAGQIRCVTTVHDVIPMIFPHHAPKSKKSRLYPIYRRLMLEVGARSDIITTDSNASRNDIISHLHIPDSETKKVRTIYCGVSSQFRPPETRDYDTPTKTILYVGRSDPYKNLSGLIKAYAKAKSLTNIPLKLRIIGPPDKRYPEPMQTAEKFGVKDSIEWTGYMQDSSPVSAYQQADLLVHLSMYEGFGLQVAEAMACGTPVLCSNAASLPEVAGNAAILVDYNDTDGISSKMVEILSKPELAREMSAKGLEQAKKFTWHQTAKETLEIYEQLS